MLRLVTTPVHDLPVIQDTREPMTLSVNSLSQFWISVIDCLGYVKQNPALICSNGSPVPITHYGEWAQDKCVTGLKEDKFSTEEIFEEGQKGAHDPCAWAAANSLGNVNNQPQLEKSIKGLLENRDRSKDENIFIATTIRLAKTRPERLPGWNDNGLPINLITVCWAAANRIFGSLWDVPEKTNPTDLHDDMMLEADEDINMETTQETKKVEFEQEGNPKEMDDQITYTGKATTIISPPSILKPSTRVQKNVQSPPKKLKTSDYNQREANDKSTIRNPYNNFAKVDSKMLRTGKKSKKVKTLRTILRARLPVLIEDVSKWNEMTTQAIKLLHMIWKQLLFIEPQESTIEYWEQSKSNCKPLKLDLLFRLQR